MKPEIKAVMTDARVRQLERLTGDEPHRVSAYRIEADIIEDLKRIHYYAKRNARVAVPQDQSPKSAR